MFLALVPEVEPEGGPEAPAPMRPLEFKRDERDILEDILLEMRAIRMALGPFAGPTS